MDDPTPMPSMNKAKAEALLPKLKTMFPQERYRVTLYSSGDELLWWVAIDNRDGTVLHIWDCDVVVFAPHATER